MSKKILTFILIFFCLLVIIFSTILIWRQILHSQSLESFSYSFSQAGILNESGSMIFSSSPYFWLNSGGQLIIENGIGKTMQGISEINNKWRSLYEKNNPLDTDGGKYPQNLFRLITKSRWQNFSQEIYFNVQKINQTNSPNRNESNGVLLMSRYKDSDNLYYAGLRVDNTAVIKKKINGIYYTLANPAFTMEMNKWIGIRSEIRDLESGKVEIRLYVDEDQNEEWRLVAQAVDEGEVVAGMGHAGIRTDFMDVLFSNYHIEKFK